MLSRSPAQRLPRTVLFTDIVGSTEMAAEVGDRRWRRTVARHHELIRRELRRHRGREIDTAGDGFFAIFESPTDAVRCAAAVIAAVHGIGLRIRAGVHTGEVEQSGGKAGGIAVHIGARLMAAAGPEEVLVSGTVHDLVAGSGHEFEDRGERELKGVPGRWRVYALVLPRLDASVATADEEERAAGGRRLLIGAVGVAGLAMLLAGAVVAWLLLRPSPPATGSGTVVAFASDAAAPVGGWQVGRGPAAMTGRESMLWVANIDAGTVARLDLDSGSVTTIGQVGAHPAAIVVVDGQVWVADPYADRLSVLSASDGALVRQLQLHAVALADGGQVIWAADNLRDRVVAIDRQTFAVVADIALPDPAGPAGLAVVEGVLWIAAPRANALMRVDPTTQAISVHPIDIGRVTLVAAAGGQLWAASRESDTVVRLDGPSGRVAARADVCDAPVAVAPFDGGAWVACATERVVWRLDASGAVGSTIELDGVPSDAVATDNRVWVSLRGD